MQTSIANVDAYLQQFSGIQKATLEKMRRDIKAAAPGAEEVISYGMPAYKQNGIVCYFAGFRNHCSFFPAGNNIIAQFQKELAGYELSKGTIRFPIDKPLPSALVKKMIHAKLSQNEAKLLAKKNKSYKSKHITNKQQTWQQKFL